MVVEGFIQLTLHLGCSVTVGISVWLWVVTDTVVVEGFIQLTLHLGCSVTVGKCVVVVWYRHGGSGRLYSADLTPWLQCDCGYKCVVVGCYRHGGSGRLYSADLTPWLQCDCG